MLAFSRMKDLRHLRAPISSCQKSHKNHRNYKYRKNHKKYNNHNNYSPSAWKQPPVLQNFSHSYHFNHEFPPQLLIELPKPESRDSKIPFVKPLPRYLHHPPSTILHCNIAIAIAKRHTIHLASHFACTRLRAAIKLLPCI